MSSPERGDFKLWALVGAGFLAVILAYTVFFFVASRHPIESVPLEQRSDP